MCDSQTVWRPSLDALVLAAVFPWLLIAVGAWLAYQFVLQNGRIFLRLEAIENRLANGRPGDNLSFLTPLAQEVVEHRPARLSPTGGIND